MWLGPIAQVLVLSAMAAPDATANLPAPVATRQTLFAIPFRIEPVADPAREPVEVQLLVSGDRGASWQLYSRVEPSRRRFMFRAGADGELWFAVRTKDRSGQLRPENVTGPEMRVIVDTMPAKVQLQAEQGQAGQITASWQIDEPHPKPSSLSIQFRTTPDGEWQTVALDRQQSPAAEGSPQTGQVTWWPEAGTGEIQIRAEVSDLAGNLAVSHAQIKPAQAASAPADLTAQNPAAQPADVAGPVGTSWPAQQPQGPVGSAGRGDLAWNQTGGGGASTGSQGSPRGGQSGAASSGGGDAGGWSTSPDMSGNGFATADNREGGSTTGHYAGYRYPQTGTTGPPSGDGGRPTDPPLESLTSSVNPAIQNQYTPPEHWQSGQTGAGSTAGRPNTGMPEGEQVRMVNSREFQLEYDVSAIGSSGISRVELWGTQDGGNSWRRLAVDDDNRSPINVRVDQEGTYGMTVTVASGAGMGGVEPRPGDQPQLLVGVDLTEPTVRITSAQPGTGMDTGRLVVCWEADDQRLAARPISLSYAAMPGGPWTDIATGLENSGRYAWPTDRVALQSVYLRLIVRDAAGNASVCETTEPISLGRAAPTAEIRDVRPVQAAGQPAAGSFGYGYGYP